MTDRVVCLFHRGFGLFPRGFKQVETLNEAGYDVEVLCTARSDLPEQDEYRGVPISRIPVPWPAWAPLKPFAMLLIVALLYFHARRRTNVDVFHCFGVYSLVAGASLYVTRRTALSYDAFEDYYYQTARSGVLGPFSWLPAKIVEVVEGQLVARTDHVFTVPSADDILERRFERVTDNITTVGNVPRLAEGEPQTDPELESKHSDCVTVLYVGGLFRQKGSIQMARVARRVVEKTDDPVEFLFIGSFLDDSEAEVRHLIDGSAVGDQIELVGFIPYEAVEPYLAVADIALQLYERTPWHEQSRGSSKLFRYMAAGLPIVISDFPGIGTIVSDASCGIPVDPTDTDAAVDAVLDLVTDEAYRSHLGSNGRNAFRTRYNWKVEKKTFLESFASIRHNA